MIYVNITKIAKELNMDGPATKIFILLIRSKIYFRLFLHNNKDSENNPYTHCISVSLKHDGRMNIQSFTMWSCSTQTP